MPDGALVATNFVDCLDEKIKTASCLWLACSGGMDSMVLLHLFAAAKHAGRLAAELRVLHINHQLHEEAALWQQQICDTALQWHMPCLVKKVTIAVPDRNLEEQARLARRQVFAKLLQSNEYVVTAHHQRDQAETLLLQLLRGTGITGLAAMPSLLPMGQGHLYRPLLAFSADHLRNYANHNALIWCEDPSNHDQRFSRNFLRHSVLPLLRQHWPQAEQSLARAADHCAQAHHLMTAVTAADLLSCQLHAGQLDLKKLQNLPLIRQKPVVRMWLKQQTGCTLTTSQFLDFWQQLHAVAECSPQLNLANKTVRRFRGVLYCLQQQNATVYNEKIAWDGQTALRLPSGPLLCVKSVSGQGIKRALLQAGKSYIAYRRGGERCQLAGKHHSQSLKKLLQEYAVPPWQRNTIPLLFIEDELAAVIGYWYCQPFMALAEEDGVELHLQE